MNYVRDLVDLICGANGGDGQIDTFIKKTMKDEYTVENGNPPSGPEAGTHRFGTLHAFGPRESSRYSEKLRGVNDPLYASNMIDRMNTPFDHVERILLQDLSETMKISGENYFKSLISITNKGGSEYGMTKISMADREYPFSAKPDYSPVNDVFGTGQFFIDSFTYTPFIDYSQTEYGGEQDESPDVRRTGVYADQFLNDYNCGRYEKDYVGEGKKTQVDTFRHVLTSNMFELRNLEKDIYDAKFAFRDAIDRDNKNAETDAKVYIYTFCEHLATLFAKLSNIRMSHEIYGFKHPHHEWEGMLALDIWYQLLFREIDMNYGFDDRLLDMNPMTRLPISGGLVQWNGTWLSQTQIEDLGLEWIEDASAPGYAYIWNQQMFDTYDANANAIADKRAECVTPRGVLKKIHNIITRYAQPTIPYEIHMPTGGWDGEPVGYVNPIPWDERDFDWFFQPGKVYSDKSKSLFTKYANLHLGRAYELMSARDYYWDVLHRGETDVSEPASGKYQKPLASELTLHYKQRMIDVGWEALYDAFCVVKNEHLFNIFNSNTNEIEEFKSQNAKHYSQGQCAIVIERIFSRIYKYLQFKSTSNETFQQHINIDSGYKYLTTETLYRNDNPNSWTYFTDDDPVPYLRYLTKLHSYLGSTILSDDENVVLGQFLKVLSRKPAEWLQKNWNLCPLCESASDTLHSLMAMPMQERQMRAAKAARDGETETTTKRLIINFALDYGTWRPDSIEEVNGMNLMISTDNQPSGFDVSMSGQPGSFRFSLSQVKDAIVRNPCYSDSGLQVEYNLVGFSRERNGEVVFGTTSEVRDSNFGDSNVLNLYAIWETQYIVKFSKGDLASVDRSMQPFVAPANGVFTLESCKYVPNVDIYTRPMLRYFSSESWESPESMESDQKVQLYAFDGWNVSVGGQTWNVADGGRMSLPKAPQNRPPVVTLVANWKMMYAVVPFMIGEEKYCEVLVNMDRKTLDVYPQTPNVIGKVFLWWDTSLGSYILDVDRNETKIVCGDCTCPDHSGSEQEEVISLDGDQDGPIVCQEQEYAVNNTSVNAILSDTEISESEKINIVFRFLELDQTTGKAVQKEVTQIVAYNSHVPSFHIHNSVEDSDGHRKVFRYWRLDSGTVTSSMTVLSDCVLLAVYDDVMLPQESPKEDVDTVTPNLWEKSSQDDAPALETCDHLSTSDNREGCRYCKYNWVDPKMGSDAASHEVGCPYVRLLLDGDARAIVAPGDTFVQMTLLEIDDISNLLKALFKINIDIAHREYFLKIDVPGPSDWWYGYRKGELGDIICDPSAVIVCPESPILCDTTGDVICGNEGCVVCGDNSQIVCGVKDVKLISFEPAVEFKFSNFHAANQVENGKLICTVSGQNAIDHPDHMWITPVNRELLDDAKNVKHSIHYNDFWYFYDYASSLNDVIKTKRESGDPELAKSLEPFTKLQDEQYYYTIQPLYLYENTDVQSPTDPGGFIRHKLGAVYPPISRRPADQLKTFMTIVKKYRPVIMPGVRDIFNECQGQTTKYEADVNNDYGVFGWCSIPSKTMVNMEYNEQAIIVPSSYDHHNRIGGSNFLQMDKDLKFIYTKWNQTDPSNEDDKTGTLEWNAKNSWYYLYNTRDWTYFLKPFFNVKQNNELYSYMLDTYYIDLENKDWRPKTSDHINGVIFEQSNEGRTVDTAFGNIATSCEFLAKYHHNENNLRILSERYVNAISYTKLVELTQLEGSDQFNSMYGSRYENIPDTFRFPQKDWIDDYDKTGSFVDLTLGDYKQNPTPSEELTLKYTYNLGQSYAIDDFDEDSVWFYITMVTPIEELNQVIELEDIMPFVFWWENRGAQNNGPTAVCYGRSSSAKLNYEVGGWCYSNALERDMTVVDSDQSVKSNGEIETEHLWHAVQHTIGTDFSKKEYGGTVLTSDNSGNVYKGAFDPNCSGTDEKWKIHHPSNAFGANQSEDPVEDKYHLGYKTHGERDFPSVVPQGMNDKIMESLQDRPMCWNLWNVVRHYAYMRYFKNIHRALGSEEAAWHELENYTKKLVKGIYRTFQQSKWHRQSENPDTRSTFGDVDGSSTNYGEVCDVHWTNSFVEISTILERNAREHCASFVLFTGDENKLGENDAWSSYGNLLKFTSGVSIATKKKVSVERAYYDAIRGSKYNFRVLTLDGVDGDDDEDGMRPRRKDGDHYVWDKPEELSEEPDPDPCNVYQGFKYGDLPTTYVLGDSAVYSQQLPDIDIPFLTTLDLDKEFPEAEYYLNSSMQKWVRRISRTVMNRQIFPVYTSMEGMKKSHHDLTMADMKSITFQVVPQFYWKYEWSFNEFMIHRVGKLNSPSEEIVMYDMLGNVWEWVRDDWTDQVSTLNGKVNPIVQTGNGGSTSKVIKGGAFDQFVRKTISPAREELSWDKFRSRFSTQANVGFRPSMVYSSVGEGGFTPGVDPVDIFFLFDASASQDSEITKMLDSAKNIVRMFSGDSEHRDICHVGSALFLGPTLRLMCCKQITLISQVGWWPTYSEWTTEWSSHYHTPKYTYSLDVAAFESSYPWPYADISPDYYTSSEKRNRETHKPRAGRESWVELSTFSYDWQTYPQEWGMWSRYGADGKPSGLFNKFKNFRDNVWMANATGQKGIAPLASKDEYVPIPGDDVSYDEVPIEQLDELDEELENLGVDMEGEEDTPQVQLMGMRDGGGTGGTGSSCFVAGTKVSTPNGLVDIEKVKTGDIVQSWNEDTGTVEPSKVVRTMRHDVVNEEIFSIHVNGEVIRATGIHPFMVVGDSGYRTWVKAKNLSVGTLLSMLDGSTCSIEQIEVEVMNTQVFNLEVDGNHTYYVGGSGVLVHNKGGDSDGGKTYWPKKKHATFGAKKITKYMNVFSGVPTWKEPSNISHFGEENVIKAVEGGRDVYYKVHFGEIPSGDQSEWEKYDYKDGSTEVKGANLYKSKFNFFTYDPTENGIDSFEWPFRMAKEAAQRKAAYLKAYKGVISNWWAGCEPSCDMLAKLLKQQCFYGYPYHIGLGYLFRKEVPRLVFVFTNEYDNSMVRTYNRVDGSVEKEVTYVPSVSGQTVTFHTTSKGMLGSDQNAPDPYCTQLLRNYDSVSTKKSFENYVDSLSLDPGSDYIKPGIDAVEWLGMNSGLMNAPGLVYQEPDGQKVNVNTKYRFGDSQTIKIEQGKQLDINQSANPLGESGKPLTKWQMNYIEQNNGLCPYTNYTFKNKSDEKKGIKTSTSFGYRALKTMGFYQLNLALRDHVNYPLNTYFMLQDANAPTPLFNVGDNPDFSDENVRKKVALSLFPEKDSRLFKDLGKCTLPPSIETIFQNAKAGGSKNKSKDENGAKYIWQAIRNVAYHWHAKADWGTSVEASDGEGKALDVIFGLENPYEKTTIAFTRRDKMDDLLKKKGWSNSKEYFKSSKKVEGVTVTTLYFPYLLGVPANSEIVQAQKNTKQKWNKFVSRKWERIENPGSTPVDDDTIVVNLGEEEYVMNKGKKIRVKVVPGVEEWLITLDTKEVVSEDEEFRTGFSIWLRWNIWNKYGAKVPTNWIQLIHYWSCYDKDGGSEDPKLVNPDTGEELPVSGQIIPTPGKLWIDKHLCPWFKRGYTNRTKKTAAHPCRRMNRYDLTQDNFQLMGFMFTSSQETGSFVYSTKVTKEDGTETTVFSLSKTVTKDDGTEVVYNKAKKGGISGGIYPCFITDAFSSECFCVDFGYNGKLDNYVWLSAPHDYITITYKKGGQVTGTMKLITIRDKPHDATKSGASGKKAVLISSKIFNTNNGYGRKVLNAIGITTEWSSYPGAWAAGAKAFAHASVDSKELSNKADLFTDRRILEFLYNFYKNIKRAMPVLLGYRFQKQIFSQYTNKDGKWVTDYDDPDNSVVVKSMPIMDVEHMYDTFIASFGVGQFNSSKSFAYSHCLVDLDPEIDPDTGSYVSREYADLDADTGHFPMKFAILPDVNIDEYKTKMLVMSRVDKISGEKFDNYTMGSRRTDYDRVTDPYKLKYRDSDSVVVASPECNASVSLGNGASYQKKVVDMEPEDVNEATHRQNDLYGYVININQGWSNGHWKTKKDFKHFRNRHLFMDPFALTIAQWCYVMLNKDGPGRANQQTARQILGFDASNPDNSSGKFREIEKSYWKYLITWENDDWQNEKRKYLLKEWKAANPQEEDETNDQYDVRSYQGIADDPTLEYSDDFWTQQFIDTRFYNPLEDTRPYYYATYQDVRGTSQVYVPEIPRPESIPASSWKWSNFMIDPSKGEEFQMNSRSMTESFMDILNHKVIKRGQKRIFGNGEHEVSYTQVNQALPSTTQLGQNDPVYGVPLVTYYRRQLDYNQSIPQTEESILAKIENKGLKGSERDAMGETYVMTYLMDARDDALGLTKKARRNTWCNGVEAGINFDLPTEAQWEYCCRAGDTYAFPREHDLGLNFEERNEALDLIAWYKYKVIGSLPEPERFCTWRISKMLFGISKDKEQINNVYETTPD